jgi:hypothetical protein
VIQNQDSMNFKLVEKFSLVLILLLCHFSNVFSDGTVIISNIVNNEFVDMNINRKLSLKYRLNSETSERK